MKNMEELDTTRIKEMKTTKKLQLNVKKNKTQILSYYKTFRVPTR